MELVNVLPEDILIEIGNKLSLSNQIIFYRTIKLKNMYKKCRKLFVLRMQLYLKISRHIKFIKNQKINYIRKLFNLPYSNKYIDNRCWLYAPFVTGGLCRGCFQLESEHYLTEKCSNILLRIYNEEIYANVV